MYRGTFVAFCILAALLGKIRSQDSIQTRLEQLKSSSNFTSTSFPQPKPLPVQPTKVSLNNLPKELPQNILRYLCLKISSVRADTHRNYIDYYVNLVNYKKQLEARLDAQDLLPQPPMELVDPDPVFTFNASTDPTSLVIPGVSHTDRQPATNQGSINTPSPGIPNSHPSQPSTAPPTINSTVQSNSSPSNTTQSNSSVASQTEITFKGLAHFSYMSVILITRLRPSSSTQPFLIKYRLNLERLGHIQSLLTSYKSLLLEKKYMMQNITVAMRNYNLNRLLLDIVLKLQSLQKTNLLTLLRQQLIESGGAEAQFKLMAIPFQIPSLRSILFRNMGIKKSINASLSSFSSDIGQDYVFNSSDLQDDLLKKQQLSGYVMDQVIALYDTSPNQVIALNKSLTGLIDRRSKKIADSERTISQILQGTAISDTAFDKKVAEMELLSVGLSAALTGLLANLKDIRDSYRLVVVEWEAWIEKCKAKRSLRQQLDPSSTLPTDKVQKARGLIDDLSKSFDKVREQQSLSWPKTLEKYDVSINDIDQTLTRIATYLRISKQAEGNEYPSFVKYVNNFPKDVKELYENLDHKIAAASTEVTTLQEELHKESEKVSDPLLYRILQNYELNQIDYTTRGRQGLLGGRQGMRIDLGPPPPVVPFVNPAVELAKAIIESTQPKPLP